MTDFGKRVPKPPQPAVKRSQNVPFKMMAGAGAAALGVYAIAPNSACPQGRLYETVEQCISDNKLSDAICRDGFAKSRSGGAGVLFSGARGANAEALIRNASGMTTFEDGLTPVPLGEVCRRGDGRQSSSSSSRSYFGGTGGSSSSSSGSSGRGWFSAFSGGDSGSSTSSSSSGGEGSHSAVSRGGFGSTGHAFSGGGG